MNEFFVSPEGRKLVKVATGLLGILTILAIFKIVSEVQAWSEPTPAVNTITVSGQGYATSTPDIAEFTFSVSQDDKTVSAAEAPVASKMQAILAGLKGLGIADKDIQTSGYDVYPKYHYENAACPAGAYCPSGRQILDGYTVSESVTVKVRDMDNAGQALALVGDKGATNVSGLSLTLDDPNAPFESARLSAIDDARAKADMLAKRLGVRLGKVVAYDDGSSQGPGPVYSLAKGMGGADAAVAPPIPTGENKVSATVSVTYEIK